MNRVRVPRWLTWTTTAALAFLALPSAEAEAAKPQKGSGFHEGGYIQLTPGSLVLPFAQDERFFDLDPAFGWGLGGGYMFARGKLFKATVGGVFEHTVLPFDGVNLGNFGGHLLRFMPEGRIGLGTRKVWGYGLLGAGVAGLIWNWNVDGPLGGDFGGRNSVPGFTAQLGGGVQGIVWKNLFLGGEVDVDLGFFVDEDRDSAVFDGYEVYSVAFEMMIGWVF